MSRALRASIKRQNDSLSLLERYHKAFKYPLTKFQTSFIDDDWIYLLYSPARQLYKIGVTTNVTDRVAEITHATGDLTLYCVEARQMEPGRDERAVLLERLIMDYFKSKNVGGEWFMLNKMDLVELRCLSHEVEGVDVFDCKSTL